MTIVKFRGTRREEGEIPQMGLPNWTMIHEFLSRIMPGDC